MRGGAVIFGPQVRSHGHKLPKKIKKLALKMVISKKLKDGKLVILELKINKPKTSLMKSKLLSLKLDSVALFIEDKVIDKNFMLAVKNVPKIDVLPLVESMFMT